MNKEEKATRYIQEKMFPRIVNAVRQEEQRFTKEELREAFETGWDEALKSQWIMVEERTPNTHEEVFVMFEQEGEIRIESDVYYGDDFCNSYTSGVWYFGGEKIIAWMPIPSFDNIL